MAHRRPPVSNARRIRRLAVVALLFATATSNPLPDRAPVNYPRPDYNEGSNSGYKQTDSGESESNADEFPGTKRQEPENCYRDEKAGDCAARMVQERVASFYIWLILAALAQVVVGTGTVWAIFRQVKIMATQERLLRGQLRATVDTAKAAERSAEAAISVALPRLHVTRTGSTGFGLRDERDPKAFRGVYFFQVETQNFGGTTAFIREVIINLGIAEELPLFPKYRPDLAVSNVPPAIRADKSFIFTQNRYSGVWDDDEIASVVDGSKRLFLFCRFIYSDYLGDEHVYGVCGIWNRESAHFDLERGHTHYSYYQYHRRESQKQRQ